MSKYGYYFNFWHCEERKVDEITTFVGARKSKRMKYQLMAGNNFLSRDIMQRFMNLCNHIWTILIKIRDKMTAGHAQN